MNKSVVFDFDGVIHSYKSGWQGYDVISDPPVEGIKEAICAIRDAGYRVYVVSSRCAHIVGVEAVQDWLRKYGIYVDGVCQDKPPAVAYIDDRAICFDGDAKSLLNKIENLVPWYLSEALATTEKKEDQNPNTKHMVINMNLDFAIHSNTELLKDLIIEAQLCRSTKKKERYVAMIKELTYNIQELIDAQDSYTKLFED